MRKILLTLSALFPFIQANKIKTAVLLLLVLLQIIIISISILLIKDGDNTLIKVLAVLQIIFIAT